MQQRLSVSENVPEAYKLMLEMEKFIATTDIDIKLRELIKIRCSQINHCAYCLDMHIKDALKEGVSAQKINLVAAWNESIIFTEAERAALAFAEEVTNISDYGVSDDVYFELKNHFTQKQIAQLIIIINQINSWNRIAVSSLQPHPID